MKQPLHSFANRLTRRILLLWILMMSAIAAIVFFKAESGMTGLPDAHYNDVLDLTDEKVQGILRSVEISAVNIREGVERDLSSPDDVYASLERELGLNAHLKGCAIAFVSDYFPTEGHWFEPSVSRTKEGSMERRQLSVPEQNYSSSPLFNLTLTTGTDVWLDSHLDRNGDRMMPGTSPILSCWTAMGIILPIPTPSAGSKRVFLTPTIRRPHGIPVISR